MYQISIKHDKIINIKKTYTLIGAFIFIKIKIKGNINFKINCLSPLEVVFTANGYRGKLTRRKKC